MLFRKMLRDLKGNPVQFISIFLMTFMGIFIFTGINAVGEGMEQSSKDFYKESNLADAHIYGLSFTKEEERQLEKEDGIEQVERRLQVDANLKEDASVIIQLNVIENSEISTNYLIEGEDFTSDKDGVWLDASFAEANSIKVGDDFSVLVQGQDITKKVLGLVMNPEYVYRIKDENEIVPDHKTFGFAVLSINSFVIDLGTEIPMNQLLLKTEADKKSIDQIKNKVFKEKQAILVMKEDFPSYRMYNNEVNQMKAMEAIFPVAFLLIAFLTTLTTMTRITVNQRTQIGTLKALGFSDGKILRHYMNYGAFTGAVGGILGLIAGPAMLTSLLFSFQKNFYTLPEWRYAIETEVFVAVVFGILLISFSGYYASRKQLKGAAAQILRPKAPKAGKHTRLEKTRWWNSLNFEFQWNIRDLLRNKLRSLITVIGIFGSMALILCALGLRDTTLGLTKTAYEEVNTYETKVILSETIAEDSLKELREIAGRQFIQEKAIELKLQKDVISKGMTVVGEGDFIHLRDLDNEVVSLPQSGITITNRLAQSYDLSIGDTLNWRLYGTNTWITSEIMQVIRNPLGQGVFLSERAYEDMGLTLEPTAILTNEGPEEFRGSNFSTVQSKEDLMETMDSMMETMNVMIATLIMAAVILGAVVLYNLGVISFHERVREFTTLKVLGFQYSTLRKLLQMQNIWLTIMGIMIGVPGGYLLLAYMLQFMGDSFDMLPHISLLSYGYSIVGTLLLSVVVIWFLSRKLKTIDMVSALKAVE